MTEQQLEALEKIFPKGVIVHRQPNGAFEVTSFGVFPSETEKVAMNRLVDFIVDPEGGLSVILSNTELERGEKI
jgi:hypothetical protein